MATLVRSASAPRRRAAFWAQVWTAYQVGRTRARLRDMPDHMLADIGVSREQAQEEAGRPSWNVPGWWRA